MTHDTPSAAKADRRTTRVIFSYSFEGGGYVQMIIGGDVDIEEVLETAGTLLAIKREEIAKRPAPPEDAE